VNEHKVTVRPYRIHFTWGKIHGWVVHQQWSYVVFGNKVYH